MALPEGAELEQLKFQIKEEVLRELKETPRRTKSNFTKKSKALVEQCFPELDSYKRNALETSLNTLARIAFCLSNVSWLTGDKEEAALQLTKDILAEVLKYRNKAKAEHINSRANRG